jgi:hypothetical protein
VLKQKSQGRLQTSESSEKDCECIKGIARTESERITCCSLQLHVPKNSQKCVVELAHEIQLTTEMWVIDPMKRVKYRNFMLTETDEDESCNR